MRSNSFTSLFLLENYSHCPLSNRPIGIKQIPNRTSMPIVVYVVYELRMNDYLKKDNKMES